MERPKLFQYVRTLNPILEGIFQDCENMVKESADTLDENFQVAAAILKVFEQRAEESNHA